MQRLADDEFAAFQLEGAIDIFGPFTINLLDEIDIDYDTHEYRLDGDCWISALAVDNTSVYVDYPELIPLTDEELGSLAPLLRDIEHQTGIAIHPVASLARRQARDKSALAARASVAWRSAASPRIPIA